MSSWTPRHEINRGMGRALFSIHDWPSTEPIKSSFVGAMGLHFLFFGAMVVYGIWFSHWHGNEWGNNSPVPGAIEATLVSNAPSIPLPQVQAPTENVLATETPSPAPAPPEPKAAPVPEPEAIPIAAKPEKVKPVPQHETPPQHPQPAVPPKNKVQYGEAQAPRLPQSNPAASAPSNNPVNVGGDFGAMFGWYVDVIKRKAGQNWYRAEVDPHTPNGTRVYLTFQVARDGTPSNVRIEKSSGSPSLDNSALHALQRVDTFGPLPNGYRGSSLPVEYYFEY